MRRIAWLLLLLPSIAHARDRAAALPHTIVWAWEQPQDLRFLASRHDVGVAWLAATLVLDHDFVREQGRRQPLRLPAGTVRFPVVRIELGAAPTLSARQRREVVARLRAHARGPALQVDFDAPLSARPFQRALLTDLRAALPDSVALSMTALASWCEGDAWVQGLPVDEIVPMAFRMGADARAVRERLAERGSFACARCRGSVGLDTEEPVPGLAPVRRTYWFHAGAWTADALR